jgi:hypothetical protein
MTDIMITPLEHQDKSFLDSCLLSPASETNSGYSPSGVAHQFAICMSVFVKGDILVLVHERQFHVLF